MKGLRYILARIKNMPLIAVSYLVLIIECLAPVIAIKFQQEIIDHVFIEKAFDNFTRLIILYAIFFFGQKLFFTCRRVAFFELSYQVQEMLTRDFLHKLHSIPFKNTNDQHVGILLNHVRNDISDASDLSVNQIMSEMMKSIVSIIILTYTMIMINIRVLVIIVVLSIIYSYILRKYGEKIKEFAKVVRKDKGSVSMAIEECISSIREIVAFNREEWQLKNYQKKYNNYYRSIIQEGILSVKLIFIGEPFLYGTKILTILIGGFSAINNTISIGEFVASYALVDALVTEIGALFKLSLTGKKLDAAVDSIRKIMDIDDDVFGDVEIESSVKSLIFKDVTFSYPENKEPVLEGINLSIPIGKKVAFVGKSGSGKSTIAQLLVRNYKPDKGNIYINSIPIDEYNSGYKEKVSIVLQQPYFMPETIKENVLFGNKFSMDQLDSICEKMVCEKFINNMSEGYETIVGERGVTLSGGQKQRLALCRVLLREPELLILDESTSALDMETEFQVQKNIDHLREGKTTIIIAHRLSTIKNADIIYVIDKGRILDMGTHDKLLADCREYNQLYSNTKIEDIEVN